MIDQDLIRAYLREAVEDLILCGAFGEQTTTVEQVQMRVLPATDRLKRGEVARTRLEAKNG